MLRPVRVMLSVREVTRVRCRVQTRACPWPRTVDTVAAATARPANRASVVVTATAAATAPERGRAGATAAGTIVGCGECGGAAASGQRRCLSRVGAPEPVRRQPSGVPP
jgi:hypothetical protein